MTYREIAEMIASIGLPYTYYSFPIGQAPNLPYIVFYYPSNDDFSADNKNYVPILNVNVELYTQEKDFDTEATVETVLAANGIYYSKTESYLESEQMYEVLYEFQLVKEN